MLNKKNSQCLLLLLILISEIFLIVKPLNDFSVNQDYTNDVNKTEEYINEQLLKTSNVAPMNYSGKGDNINITLHQSLVNFSKVEITNTSDYLKNNFRVACPKDTSFNSSFINITFNQIFAPNKSLIIEDDAVSYMSLKTGGVYYTSFQIIGDCYIKNFSVMLGSGAASTITARIFNASSQGGNLKYHTDLSPVNYQAVYTSAKTSHWENFTNINLKLDTSNTQNNTYFIAISSDNGLGRWFNGTEGDIEGDETIVYNSTKIEPLFTDLTLKIDLTPINNFPNPKNISLKINGSMANGYDTVNGSGFWLSRNPFSSLKGQLKFNITAEWYDVKCNISYVQINYTKLLFANSLFRILECGGNVFWNVTQETGLNYFNTKFSNYTIDFTIPLNWDPQTIEVWNGTSNKTNTLKTWVLANGYRLMRVPCHIAGNGSFWFLNASSPNLLKSIITVHRGYEENINTFSKSNIIQFKANFSTLIHQNDGILNLSIYSPKTVSNNLNYTAFNGTHLANDIVPCGNWNISKNITNYGYFRAYLNWHNGSSAGFINKSIEIISENTTHIISSEGVNLFKSRDENFTYEFQYIDEDNNNVAIEDGTVEISKNAGDLIYHIKTLSNGIYSLEFNPKVADMNKSPFNFTYKIWKVGENPQSKTLKITLLQSWLNLTIIHFNRTLFRNKNPKQIIGFSLNENKTRAPILGIQKENIKLIDANTLRNWKSNWNLIESYNGKYKLELEIDQDEYPSGFYTILVNVSKSPNYNYTIKQVGFSLYGNNSFIYIESLWNEKVSLKQNKFGYFKSYRGLDFNIQFKIIDNLTYLQDPLHNIFFNLTYYNLQSGDSEFISNTIQFNSERLYYSGTVKTSSLEVGNYSLRIDANLKNYRINTRYLLLEVNQKRNVSLSIYFVPDFVNAGEFFYVGLFSEYYNKTDIIPLEGASVGVEVYVNNHSFGLYCGVSNLQGITYVIIVIPYNTKSVTIKALILDDYYHFSTQLLTIAIKVNTLTDQIIRWIFTIITLSIAVIALNMYYKRIYTRKRVEKKIISSKVLTELDIILHFKQIILFHKKLKKIIYIKSFTDEKINLGYYREITEKIQELKEDFTIDEKTLVIRGNSIIFFGILMDVPEYFLIHQLKNIVASIEVNHKGLIDESAFNEKELKSFYININSAFKTNLGQEFILTKKILKDLPIKKKSRSKTLNIIKKLVNNYRRIEFTPRFLIHELNLEFGWDIRKIMDQIQFLITERYLVPIPVLQQEDIGFYENILKQLNNNL